MRTITLILIILQFIDVFTTYIALKNSTLFESNKVVSMLIDKIGLIPALVVIKGAFIILLWKVSPFVPSEVLLAILIFYCWVVFNNVKAIYGNR